MEFHITMAVSPAQISAIEDAFLAIDPSVLVDIDPSGRALRVATSLDVAQLVALMGQAGFAVAQNQVALLPSICCGGCSG